MMLEIAPSILPPNDTMLEIASNYLAFFKSRVFLAFFKTIN